jgi:Flp pilus assembly protein protease CpaA
MILNVIFSLFYTNIVLVYCMYRDIKYRKISNETLFGFLLVGSLSIFTEVTATYYNIYSLIFTKLFFLILVAVFSFILFCLKAIGGSDGKLLIMLIFFYPTQKLNIPLVFSFFFIFLFLYFLLMLARYFFFKIHVRNNTPEMLYSLQERFTFSHKVFIMVFFRFLDFSQITNCQNNKYIIKSLNLLYNRKKEKFQILAQYRPPLVILIFFMNNYMMFNYFF